MRLNVASLSSTSWRSHRGRKTLILVQFVTVLCFMFMLTSPAFGQSGGGVGAGGSGGSSGSGDEAHWTNRGWGWAIYDAAGAGPTDGFRNGYNWADAQTTCRVAGASQVYAHIILDNFGKAMVYDYASAQDTPSRYAGALLVPGSVDSGKASTITTATAQTEFDKLGASGVNTAGFTFGNNVGWFCANFAVPDGSCSITSAPGSVVAGQNFTASIVANNTGTSVWSVDPTVPNRFKIGSSNPQNNNTWSKSRVEIAGVPSGYGSVVFNGTSSSSTPNPDTFTAPATPGVYSFSWQILAEGVSWYGPVCSVNITVLDSNGYVQGRVFNDMNGNGAYEPVLGETLIQNPAAVCGAAYENQPAAVSISGVGVYNMDQCNPDPYYRVTVPAGAARTVSLNTPSGWQITTPAGGSHSVAVANGTTYDLWFGMWIPDLCPNKPGLQWPALDPGDIKYGNSCYKITCDNSVTLLPPNTNPAPGQGFTIRIGFRVNTYSASINYDDPARDIQITNTGGLTFTSPNPQNYSPASVADGGYGYADFTVGSAPAGLYTIVWELNGAPASGAVGCTNGAAGGGGGPGGGGSPIVVSDKPYFRAYGGDIVAGAGFKSLAGACSPQAGKFQTSFTNVSGANYFGGGGSHASFATGNIVDFVSGTLRPVTPNDPDMFAFANDPATTTYGGAFPPGNLGAACATNYYDQKPTSGLTTLTSPIPVGSLANGNYQYSGNLILGGGTVGTDRRVTVYVKGDVFISSDIAYAGATSGYGSEPTKIPSLTIIAKGNIYVASTVSNIQGVFVAQTVDIDNNGDSDFLDAGEEGAGGKGIFYTCGFDRGGGVFEAPAGTITGGIITSNELLTQCTNKLNVFGSVVANAVKLLRSGGTVPGAAENYNSGDPAERFILTPDTWFFGPNSSSQPFQAYTALPPIL